MDSSGFTPVKALRKAGTRKGKGKERDERTTERNRGRQEQVREQGREDETRESSTTYYIRRVCWTLLGVLVSGVVGFICGFTAYHGSCGYIGDQVRWNPIAAWRAMSAVGQSPIMNFLAPNVSYQAAGGACALMGGTITWVGAKSHKARKLANNLAVRKLGLGGAKKHLRKIEVVESDCEASETCELTPTPKMQRVVVRNAKPTSGELQHVTRTTRGHSKIKILSLGDLKSNSKRTRGKGRSPTTRYLVSEGESSPGSDTDYMIKPRMLRL